MALIAPLSKYKIKTFLIYIAFCIVVAAIFAYDGYLSKYEWSGRHKNFYTEHFIDKGNKPDGDMIFNQTAPPFLVGLAALLGIYLFVIRNKKLVADEDELVISEREKIAYDSIQKIDKTNFSSKGFFLITYKNKNGREVGRKISDRTYDNLDPVLELLIKKISG